MPASGRFWLDTNIVIALLAGDESVLSNLDRAPKVFIPAIRDGDLFFGAAKSPPVPVPAANPRTQARSRY